MNIFEKQREDIEAKDNLLKMTEEIKVLQEELKKILVINANINKKLESKLEFLDDKKVEEALKNANNQMVEMERNYKNSFIDTINTSFLNIKVFLLYIPLAIGVTSLIIMGVFQINNYDKIYDKYEESNNYYKKKVDLLYAMAIDNNKVWYNKNNRILYFKENKEMKEMVDSLNKKK